MHLHPPDPLVGDVLRTIDVRPVLKLIPPMSTEFTVYGGAEIVERARAWAFAGRYILVTGVPACAHGMYLMGMCPTRSAPKCCQAFDHTTLWIPDRAAHFVDRPFLLTQPYTKAIPESAAIYARAHGLDVDSLPHMGDGWYQCGTLPIRFTIPESWPVWPIEREVAPMLNACPPIWPGDTTEETSQWI